MSLTNNRSRPRTQAREAEKKLMPAIKAVSNSLHKTGIIPDNFSGYKANAGEMTDNLGRKWQYQITAVCAKSDFIKQNEVIPMFKGWTMILKAKAFIKHLIDWTNK